MCSLSGCRFDEAWAITDGKKLYRLTFSLSLAELIAKQTGYQIQKVRLHLGKKIAPGVTSENGLYAICKKKTGWPLRVTMFKNMAEMWHDPASRDIREVSISVIR